MKKVLIVSILAVSLICTITFNRISFENLVGKRHPVKSLKYISGENSVDNLSVLDIKLSSPFVDLDGKGNAYIRLNGKIVAGIGIPDFMDIDYKNNYKYRPVSFSNIFGISKWSIKGAGLIPAFTTRSNSDSLDITVNHEKNLSITSPYIPLYTNHAGINRIVMNYWVKPNTVINSIATSQASKKVQKPVIFSVFAVNYYDKDKQSIGSEIYRAYVPAVNNDYSTFDYYFIPKANSEYLTIKVSQPFSFTGTYSFKDCGIYSYPAIEPVLSNYSYTTSKNVNGYVINQHYNFKNRDIIRTIIENTKGNTISVAQSVRYTKDVQTMLENEPLWVDSPWIKYVGRDFKMHDHIDAGQDYVTDYTTPYFSYFKNMALASNEGYTSIETANGINRYGINIFTSNYEDDSYFLIGDGGVYKYIYTQYYNKGYIGKLNYTILLGYKGPVIIPSRTPDGTHGTFIITHHSDSNTVNSLKAMMYGSSNEKSLLYNHTGFFHYNIPATWGFFSMGQEGIAGMDNPDYKNIIENMAKMGIEVVPHTISPVAEQNTRNVLEEYLPMLNKYGIQDWIDHSLGAGARCADIKSLGSVAGNSQFSLDLFRKNNFRYCWSYADVPLFNTLDMLESTDASFHPQIVFKNNNLGYDGYSLIQWSTYRPKNFIEEVNKANLDELVSNDGISIIHDYFNHPIQLNKFFVMDKNDDVYLTPKFDGVLRTLNDYRNQKKLWVTTVKQFIDYNQSIHNINIDYKLPGEIVINNKNSEWIKAFTLDEIGSDNKAQSIVLNLHPGYNLIKTSR